MSSPPPKRKPPGRVDFLGSFPGDLPAPTLPEVAIAGRSNVGKSSAINTLLGRKSIARTSRTPGRTQLINLFQVGERFILADLPGYGFAKVPGEVQEQWKGFIEDYLGQRESLRLVVILVDSRHDPQKNDLALLKGLRAAGLPYTVVATKADKLPKSKKLNMLAKLARGLGESSILPFSSLSGEGVDELWKRVLAATAEKAG